MPVYVARCSKCGRKQDYVKPIDRRHETPTCFRCDIQMEKTIPPTRVSVFEPYKTVVQDKERGERMLIKNQGEHRAFLRRNGFEEVGNDKSMAPLHPEEVKEQHNRQRKEAELAPVVEVPKDGFISEDIT